MTNKPIQAKGFILVRTGKYVRVEGLVDKDPKEILLLMSLDNEPPTRSYWPKTLSEAALALAALMWALIGTLILLIGVLSV